MLKKMCVIGLVLFSVALARAEVVSINGRATDEGSSLTLFGAELERGEIIFSLAGEKLTKAEISLDRGAAWQEMQAREGSFVCVYQPRREEIIEPEFILAEAGGTMRTFNPHIRIDYQDKTPDEKVEQLLEKLQSSYENRSIDRFLGLFAFNYPDRIRFQEAIQRDFYNYRNVRLHFRIERKTFNEDYTQALWDAYWQRKYDNRNGTSYSDSSTITMRLVRQGADWFIDGMNNNALFGSSLLRSPDLRVGPGDIQITDVAAGQVSIAVTVHNIGLASASNVKVSFYQKLAAAAAFTLIDSKTISSINAGSQANSASVSFTGNSGAQYDFKVVVDPDATISEAEEANNTAERRHTLP